VGIQAELAPDALGERGRRIRVSVHHERPLRARRSPRVKADSFRNNREPGRR
jgi:hypothetical protein